MNVTMAEKGTLSQLIRQVVRGRRVVYRSNIALAKNASVYVFSSFFERLIPFLLLPVLTRYLSPGDYGILATFFALVGVMSSVVGLNANQAVMRSYLDLNKSELGLYIAEAIKVTLLSFGVVLFFTSITAQSLHQIIGVPVLWVILSAVIAFFNMMTLIRLHLWQMQYKAFIFALFRVGYSLVNILLSLLFVVVLTWGWVGRADARLLSVVLFGFIAIFLLTKGEHLRFQVKPHIKYMKDILKVGVPLIPHVLAFTIIGATDRFFLSAMVGPAATGIYSVGYIFGAAVGILHAAFYQAWQPFALEKINYNSEKTNIKLVKFTYLYFVSAIIFGLVYSLVIPYISVLVVGAAFVDSSKFIFWIVMGYTSLGLYRMVANFVFYEKKNYLLGYATVTSALINVIMNYWLIKLNGPIGAAQATFIAFLCMFLITWWLSHKVHPMPWGMMVFARKRVSG